jgi:hypothetical protein
VPARAQGQNAPGSATAVSVPNVPVPARARSVASTLTGTVKIVSSMPRSGNSKGPTDTIVNAFKMALAEHNNQVGQATITYQDLDDANAGTGAWDGPAEALPGLDEGSGLQRSRRA